MSENTVQAIKEHYVWPSRWPDCDLGAKKIGSRNKGALLRGGATV